MTYDDIPFNVFNLKGLTVINVSSVCILIPNRAFKIELLCVYVDVYKCDINMTIYQINISL